MATKQSGSQWVASIGLVAALVCSPLTLSRPLAVQSQFEAPAGVEAPQGFGEWSAFRVSLELRSANDYARASKVVSRWLGELPKADARYPLRLRALVTGAEQERLTRMSIRPALADELNDLIEGHAKDAGDTVKALKPVVAQLNAGAVERISERLSAADAEARLRSVLMGLSVAEANGLNALTSLDDDGDGLTNTQEAWWCTNPLNANSDGDAASDAIEVQQAKEWVGNLRAGPSAAGRPFLNWPMQDNGGNNPNCPDGDRDGVPDLAEEWELGLNPNKESTDGDKYDDGQELFGTTLTDWGGLPRPEDPIGASMPGWVLSPGNHPFSAAFPAVIVQLSGAPINVQLVSTITSGGTIGNGTQRSYVVSDMDGSSDSKAKTKSLTDWQESSESVSEPARPLTMATTDRLSSLGENPCVPIAVPVPTPSPNANGLTGGSPPCTGIRLDYMTIPDECRELTSSWENKLSIDIGWDLGPKLTFGGSHNFESGSEKPNSVWSDYWCKQAMVKLNLGADNNAANTKQGVGQYQLGATQPQVARGLSGIQYSSDQDGKLVATKLDQIAFALNQPRKTNTKTKGHSETDSETNTHTTSREHTISNGNVWLSNDEWMTATAADTSHVADLTFNYVVRNSGSDLASRLDLLVFNVYLGSEAIPVCTYFVGADDCGTPPAPGGVLSALFPGQNASFTSHRIPLAFDQLRSLDTGSKLVIRVEMVGMASSDQAFFENAVAGGVMVSIEDGPADNDDTVDTFLIPTWGDGDTMQDVMGRHFPSQQDDDGNDGAIWTPENTNGSTPSWCVEPQHFGVSPQVWCKHALSTSDWWNIYLNNLGDGTSDLNQTLAAPNSTAFFRFNKDTDLDGYSDRTEAALSTDPFDPASHPKPELLASVHQKPAVNSVVTATASLLNTGLFDAYGTELIMIAPDDSVTILNNTVGGSGRVKAGKAVVVGSSTKLSPLPTVWSGTSHAKPSAGGYYTGSADRIYTFSASCANPGGCDVGSISNTLALNWNDGLGVTGTLSLGAGYASPTPLNVGAYGIQVSMLSGKIMNGEAFSMTAYTPRDTFSYLINRVPYTEPLVIVSYNDPQGNHRFIIPSAAMSLTTPTQNLAAFAGQMLQDPGVEIATTSAFTPTAVQSVTVIVNNPTEVSLVNAHLFLEFVNISGTVAAEFPMTASLPSGPSSLAMNWNTDAFSPTFQAGEDYIAMVFLTDYQGNILDTGGRPLSSWQADLKADFAMASDDTDWDFGSAAQGTLMKRSFTFANVGLQDMLTYIQGVPGLSLSQTGSRRVGAADQTTYEIALTTIGLPVGVYDQSIVIRSSDPARPTQTVRVHGTVSPAPGNTQPGPLVRPLDVDVTVNSGIQGEWVTYTNALGPTPQTLHPVKVYTDYAAPLIGVGRYATDFSAGTASAEMFGNGRDGDLTVGAGQNVVVNTTRTPIVTTANSGQPYVYVGSSSGFASGDKVLIVQTQGANAGVYDLATVASVGGTTIALRENLKYSYPVSLSSPQGSTCSGGFLGQYFGNKFLSGQPVFTRCDAQINFAWGDGSPGGGLGSDDFSVRWTGNFQFDDGIFRFDWTSDDGIRVFVDGHIVVDYWFTQGSIPHSTTLFVSGGQHVITVEYFEEHGGAFAGLGIVPLTASRSQVIRVPQYRNVAVLPGGILSAPPWDRSTGGILALFASTGTIISGTVDASGRNGSSGNTGSGGTGTGFWGGDGRNRSEGAAALQGEGMRGPGTYSNDSNANGGGGGRRYYVLDAGIDANTYDGGGGGGYGVPGQSGGSAGGGTGGSGGVAAGSVDASLLLFGGGGGGRLTGNDYSNSGGGGAGGGAVFIQSASVDNRGVVMANGGSAAWDGGGGGGAGGGILLRARTVSLGNGSILANGGFGGGNGNSWFGGNGGVGRVRVEYCESTSGYATPSASSAKLSCFVVEQVESTPYNQGRLNLPVMIGGTSTFKLQYGRLMTYPVSGNTSTTLRVPAGLVSTATIQSLVSGLSGPTSFSLDIGDDGSMDWTGVLANNSENTSPDLALAFNAYWATHGSPITGTLDVPVRVALGGAGQVLLTNLQMRLATSAAPASNDPPLDVTVTFTGNYSAGTWLTYTHSLGPDPVSLHPVKVYSATYGQLLGAGRYATDFAPGTASGDMFGNGTDGDLVVTSGSSVALNSTRTSVIASGTSVAVASSSGFASGDIVLFHQSQDETNAGRWELGEILSIDSANTWTLKKPLVNSYSSVFGTTCGSGWWGEYFGNPTLSGTPVYSRCDGEINYDWDTGTPGGGMPGADFSIRWTGQYYFPGGVAQFVNYGNDGMRVRLDGITIIDHWSGGWPGQGCPNCDPPANIGVTRGFHTVVVEFVNLGRGGGIRFDIQRIQRAQAIRVPRYRDVAVASGATLYAPAWNSWTGGVLFFLANGTVTIDGAVSANGTAGSNVLGTCVPLGGGAVGTGFRGGDGFRAHTESSECYWVRKDQGGWQGEGTRGLVDHIEQSNANAGGGGDNGQDFGKGAGGGGGNGTPGGNGLGGTAQGGGSSGSSDLSQMTFGGGGGGAGKPYQAQVGGGGAGAGIVGIVARYLTVNGAIQANGGAGGSSGAYDMGGGGGAGGSILIRSALPILGFNKVSATGGPGGIAGDGNGGGGGMGRIRVEYCETPSTYQTNPTAGTTQKLTCHIAEQIEASPFGQGRLSLAESLNGTTTYKIQYGRRLTYTVASSQLTQVRMPAGLYNGVTLQSLLSGLSTNTTFNIDIGDDGSIEWPGTYGNISTNNSPDLSAAFNAWWANHGAPKSGTLDVPIRVSLGGPGQVLLTNVQTQLSGNPLRFVRLPARNYSSVVVNYTVGGTGTGPLTLAADVGDDGTIDWTTTGTVAFPFTANTANLMTATNAYLAGKSGDADVPIRFYVSPSTATLALGSFVATPSLLPDASVALADVSFSDPAPTESDTISLTAVLRNGTARDTGGLVASAFAILSGTTPGAYYIGSAFVPNIPASGTATTEIAWNTLGMTGNVPVRIVLDPFNRVTETLENNNVATRTLTIVARPDLEVTQADSGGVDEIAAGETLSLTARVANRGQRMSMTQTLAVYDGNPSAAGLLLGTMLAPPINGSGTADLVFAWQPTVVGEHKLFFRADNDNAVNEYDEGNNDLVRTLFVGVAGGYDVDSGLAASDTPYSSTLGYGAIDTGQTDALNNCGSLPDDTYRRDPDGTVTYQFDRLLRNRYYHLDVVLRDCATGANRIESVEVNGIALATGIDLNDSKAHYLSFLLDPKVYDGRTITVKIKAAGSQAAIVSRVTVREVLYRYVDAGSAVGADSSWSGSRGYGWLGSYNVSTGCGAYPYQTARVNQSGNTLQYRFDGLDPAKHYKVALSLYQCTGSVVVQRLDIDGNIVGADFAAQNASLMSVTRNVPQTLYAADGSIVVTVIRKDSSVNAMIGEITLEEVTASGSPVCDGLVNPTPTYLDVKGSVFINGQPAPVGTLVTAENPQGDTVGCFYVTLSGDYGYMRVFGADDLATPPVPGMHANDPVRFRVDGVVAVGSPLLLWQADLGRYVVDLNAGATQAQSILMAPGWNFISLRVEPPVPLIQNVLETISGKYCRVLALTATSNCAISEVFRLLKQMHSGVGYYTHITSTTTANAVIEGLTQPVDKPVPLQPGWNWIGYYPPTPMPITFALQTVLTHVVQVNDLGTSFVPDDLSHSLLREMGPGKGYRVFISGTLPVTLTYPAAAFLLPGAPVEKPAEVPGLICGDVAPTPGLMFIYGRLGEGPGMPAGTRVEVLTPEGRVAGCATTGMAGEYGAVAAFGAEGDTPGFHHGDAILLRINGKALRDTGLVWINDARIHRADVPGEYGLYLPSIQSAQP